MGFWRRLLGIERPARAPRRTAPSAGAGAEERAAPGDAPPVPGGSPFEPFARALGVDVPPAPADEPSPDPDPEDLALAARILARHAATRGGPASTPDASLRMLTLVASPSADFSELARVIHSDPALTAGVLNAANSVALRGVTEIETVREAIARLGLVEVGRVAGAVSARSLFQPRVRAGLHAFAPLFEALYRRSVVVATAASAMALRVPGARADRAYLGGLLHDVGCSVALGALAGLVVDGALSLDLDDPRIGRAVELVHVELGGDVHQEWKLPQVLTVIAVRHHDREVPADPEFADLHVVRLVSALFDLRPPAGAAPEAPSRAAHEVVQSARALRLDPHAVRAAAGELKLAAGRLAPVFAAGHAV